MNDRCINHRAVRQQQATVAQITVNNLQNPTGQFMYSNKRRKLRIVVSSESDPDAAPKTDAGPWSHKGLLPSPDRCSRTSSASDEAAASPSMGKPGGRLRLLDNAARSRQSHPRHHLIHLDQEAHAAGLLTSAGVPGIREGEEDNPAVKPWRSVRFCLASTYLTHQDLHCNP